MSSSCVAAFLLSIASPFFADRMVLTEISRTHAYVYREISKATQFPLRKPSSDVLMIKSDTQSPGTSYAIYCSQKLDGKTIMQGLLNQLNPFTIDGPSKDQRRINPENSCLVQLSSMAKERNYNLIMTGEIRQSYACTGKNLMELALDGYITIHKHYYVSPNENLAKKVRIFFDEGVEMTLGEGQVYFDGEKVNGKTEDEILMWYNGYLHVFRRRINSGWWYVSTSLTSIELNGYYISRFMLHNNPQYKKFIRTWDFLENLVGKRMHYRGLTHKELAIERKRKTSHEKIERLKLDNLQPSNVHGPVSSFAWYGDRVFGN
ncbi:unnamed protein product [Blumeria hordei]|uniref:Uncharacterized protein n=2 Tax=Blumeria hordei TaxID=2867405 RepID=A0A383UIC5_BLUHO|nr:CSEP0324 putative effector protein [Blumeria hordei DH14]SZF00043.1 unnamed protein product [Blumeria hordei]